MNRFAFIFFLALVSTISLSLGSLRAQEAGAQIPGDYQDLTLENLFRLYWRTGYLKPNDEQAVTEYMQLTNCDLYKKFVKDDFNWPSVLEATSAYLGKYASSFPYQFILKQPIAFERYDVDKKWFKLLPSAAYLNVFRLQIADYRGYPPTCVSSRDQEQKHPLAAFIRIRRPLSITYVPMPETLAKEYIDFAGKLDQTKRVFFDNVAVERPAFVKFRFTILGLEAVNEYKEAVFDATLDGYDIYADQGLSLLLYSWEPEKKAKKQGKEELVVDEPVLLAPTSKEPAKPAPAESQGVKAK